MARKARPEDMPGFFKALVGDFSKRLQIPPAFAKFFYQIPLPQKIKLQNAEKSCWQVNVVEIDNKFFFNKGWKAFVEDNLLELGDFVFFSYVQRSLFRFTIFESDGCVKDVPCKGKKKQSETMVTNRQISEDNILDNEERYGNVTDKNAGLKINEKPVVIKIEDIDDEEDTISVEFLGNVSKLGKKRKRTESKPSVPFTLLEGKEAGASMAAWSDSAKSREGNGDEFTTGNCKQRKVLNKNTQKLIGREKSLVLERAKMAFKSNNPFFMVAIQPSYIGVGQNNSMNIPVEFVQTYFNKKYKNVILELPGGKTWHVKYYYGSKQRNSQAKLNGGWLAFAIDNHLAVGDACVFELINTTENILRVYIFRVNMINQNHI